MSFFDVFGMVTTQVPKGVVENSYGKAQDLGIRIQLTITIRYNSGIVIDNDGTVGVYYIRIHLV